MGVNVGTWFCLRRPDGDVHDISEGPFIARDYILYGLMAGVRGERVLFKPRGAPVGASFGLLWNMGMHENHPTDTYSHSWLTTAELEQVAEAWLVEADSHSEEPVLIDPGLAATIGAMKALDEWCRQRGEGWEALLAFDFG